jgi:hypothetical protein
MGLGWSSAPHRTSAPYSEDVKSNVLNLCRIAYGRVIDGCIAATRVFRSNRNIFNNTTGASHSLLIRSRCQWRLRINPVALLRPKSDVIDLLEGVKAPIMVLVRTPLQI